MSKVWFITGAGSGIGSGTAKAALRSGDRVVEPGFFRTDLLDTHNIRWVSKVIEDYAPEGKAEDMWSQYHGTQPGDPAKLGDALVKIAAMQNPPKLFVAGSDALSTITSAIEERLREVRANEMLSNSTEGSF
jgi:hypothetical protein